MESQSVSQSRQAGISATTIYVRLITTNFGKPDWPIKPSPPPFWAHWSRQVVNWLISRFGNDNHYLIEIAVQDLFLVLMAGKEA